VPFLVFKRRAIPRTIEQAFVTIQRKGVIAFSKAAYEALAQPEAVELLYDPERQLVGFRSVKPQAEHAYPVRVNGKKTSHMVSGTLFTRHYGIPTDVARRWPAYMEAGLLCIDLSQPGQEVGSGVRARAHGPDGSQDPEPSFPSTTSQVDTRGKEQGGVVPKPTTSGSRPAPPSRQSPRPPQRSRSGDT
jgi:hypothetical protein